MYIREGAPGCGRTGQKNAFNTNTKANDAQKKLARFQRGNRHELCNIK